MTEQTPLTFREQHFLDRIEKTKAAYEAHPVWFVLWRWMLLSAVWVGGCWFLVALEPWVRANVPAGGPGLPADWVHPLAVASNPFAWIANLGLPLLLGGLQVRGWHKTRAAWADPVALARRQAAQMDDWEKNGGGMLAAWKVWMG